MGDSIRVLEGLAYRADQIADHVDPGDGSASTGDSSRGHPLTALYEGDQRIENLHIREDHCVLAEVIGEVRLILTAPTPVCRCRKTAFAEIMPTLPPSRLPGLHAFHFNELRVIRSGERGATLSEGG